MVVDNGLEEREKKISAQSGGSYNAVLPLPFRLVAYLRVCVRRFLVVIVISAVTAVAVWRVYFCVFFLSMLFRVCLFFLHSFLLSTVALS